MFTKYQDDRTREWNKAIDRYISLHKYIKEVGKIGVSQARSGHVNNDVQTKLADALRQTDKSLYHLKEFFKPCLTSVDVTDLFPQNQYKEDGAGLAQENFKLKQEKDYFQRQLSERYGGDAMQIRDLERELSLNQQAFQRKRDIVLGEKRDLEQKVLELTQEIQSLRTAGNLASLDEKEVEELKKNGGLQVSYIKKQQELEETLKTQNDLIYDLKQQLSDCVRDREIFRSLNLTLEMELQKRNLVESPARRIIKKQSPEFQHEEELMQDYFNRRTLKIGENVPHIESLKYHQDYYGQHLQQENGVENYEPTYKSLQEIPVYYQHEKSYLKSKSYDFDRDYEIHDDSVTHHDSNSQQDLERRIHNSTEQLQKINEDEKENQDDKSNENFVNKSENI